MAGVRLTRGSCRPTSWVCRPAPRLVDWPGCSAAACPGRGHTVACAGDAFPSRGPALGPSAQPSAPAASRAWSLGCGSRWDLGSACPGRPDSARVSRAGLPSDLRLSLRGQEQFQRNPDSYNGAVRENYVWSQDYTDLELKVPVPGHVVKGRQVTRGPLAAHSSLGRGCRPGHRPQGCFSAVPPHPPPAGPVPCWAPLLPGAFSSVFVSCVALGHQGLHARGQGSRSEGGRGPAACTARGPQPRLEQEPHPSHTFTA